MKNILILFVIMSTFLMHGQSESKKIKAYQAVVYTESNKYVGFLYSADSLGVILTQDEKGNRLGLVNLEAQKISMIKIRKKGQIGRGAIIGGASGAAIGFVIGISDGDDAECCFFQLSKEEKAGIGAVVGAPVGGLIGVIVGSSRKKIEINFDQNIYLMNLAQLKNYSFQK